MQEQLVYLIGNAFRIYIYFKLLNTMCKSETNLDYNRIYILFFNQ